MKIPKDFLVDFLKSKNITTIKSRERNLNKLAIKLQRGNLKLQKGEFKGEIIEEYEGLKLIGKGGDELSGWYAGKKGEQIDLGIKLEYPKLVIDYGLWDYHSEHEKWLLKKQTLLTLQIIREHLWDRNLVLASCPKEISEFVKQWDFFGDILINKFIGDAVVLDPHGEVVLKKFEQNKVYILGGIVDKSNRMRTKELGYNLKGVRLELMGKSSNVPDRLNIITKVMCLSLNGESLETAIQQSRS